jgi:hypothetical protein
MDSQKSSVRLSVCPFCCRRFERKEWLGIGPKHVGNECPKCSDWYIVIYRVMVRVRVKVKVKVKVSVRVRARVGIRVVFVPVQREKQDRTPDF